jgi:hypothetical protein
MVALKLDCRRAGKRCSKVKHHSSTRGEDAPDLTFSPPPFRKFRQSQL